MQEWFDGVEGEPVVELVHKFEVLEFYLGALQVFGPLFKWGIRGFGLVVGL